MKELKRNKKTVLKAIRCILHYYECERSILNNEEKIAMNNTLENYSDFFEWLQGII